MTTPTCTRTTGGQLKFRCRLDRDHTGGHVFVGVSVDDGRHDDEAVDQ